MPRYEPTESTVSVVAALRGDPGRELTLSLLGFRASGSCFGGPRLAAGERVLLLLSPDPSDRLGVPDDLRVIHKSLLTEGAATAEAEDLLQRVAAVTGVSQHELDAAVAFANGEAVPVRQAEDGDLPLLVSGLSAAGAAVVMATLFFAVRRLRQRS